MHFLHNAKLGHLKIKTTAHYPFRFPKTHQKILYYHLYGIISTETDYSTSMRHIMYEPYAVRVFITIRQIIKDSIHSWLF